MAERSYPTSKEWWLHGCRRAERSYSTFKVRRSNPTPEARGGGREDQPHILGALAVWVQEGLEELSLVEGQEGQR